mgnify:FL=1
MFVTACLDVLQTSLSNSALIRDDFSGLDLPMKIISIIFRLLISPSQRVSYLWLFVRLETVLSNVNQSDECSVCSFPNSYACFSV